MELLIQIINVDLEDSATPAWNNVIEGQINLKNAINKKINFNLRYYL